MCVEMYISLYRKWR